MSGANQQSRARIDARDKVLGKALFAADVRRDNLLHAMAVPAAIAKGKILAIDIAKASRVAGVVRVLTHQDFSSIKATPATLGGGPKGPGFQPMTSDRIAYRGQTIALVLAETLEAAIAAATLVEATYEAQAFTGSMDSPGSTRDATTSPHRAGDAEAAFASSEHQIDLSYYHPQQHQNPMELTSTTAEFLNGDLHVWEGSQNTGGMRSGLAGALGLDAARIHIHSPYLGGGFGQKSALQSQTALVARAAMVTGRPVKLVVPRAQLFHSASYRPASNHRVRIGASSDGKLKAALYDVEQQNSRIDQFISDYSLHVSRMYDIQNYAGSDTIVRIDAQPAGYMRAPHEHPSGFAFEVALDELAYKLNLDPVALRLLNDTDHDPITGKPFTSRHLAECLRRGAKRFGWSRRSSRPASMRSKSGAQIGWGVAAGAYKAAMSPVIAKLRVQADGVTRIALSGHEMGQGIRSAVAAEIIANLNINSEKLIIVIGETDAAPQHVTGGSWGTASAVPAARRAVEQLKVALKELLAGRDARGDIHRQLAAVRRPYIEVEIQSLGFEQPPEALDRLRKGMITPVGPLYPSASAYSWIAHFVEVHVEASTRRIRIPRVVSVADCGRVMNLRTAVSQVHGGVVWGIGAALREAAEVDPRYGGAVNNDFADYIVPVNADIGDIEVELIDRPDTMLNPSGVKGLGEVAMVGVAPAIVNAIYHATGQRLRELPIRIEALL